MYTPQTTFTGYKIGLNTPHLYIAIPDKYWKGDVVEVDYQGETRTFRKSMVATHRTFNDKFRPGETYTLLYVLWKERTYQPTPTPEPAITQEALLWWCLM